ncbi:hypothetical protein Avbf_18846, partial [Armadillidium vulgare]
LLLLFLVLLILAGKISICDTKLSLGKCLNIVNLSLREDWFFECIAQTRLTNIIEKISFRIHVVEKMAPWVLPSSNVSLEGTEILVKSSTPFFIACYVEGRPKPKITTVKISNEIIENNVEVSLRDDNQILEFKFARTKYAGKYECSIENRVGHIQPYTNVIIEDEASALLDKNLRISIEGKAGKLNKECTIEEQAELLPYDHSYEVEKENITLGELWILVKYCRYGNLLKFIQKAKSKFINQIDPVTSDIDVGRTSPFPNNPLSPKLVGCSIG